MKRPTLDVPHYEVGERCDHGHLARKCDQCDILRMDAYINALEQYATAVEAERDEALEYVAQIRMDVRDEFAAAALTGILASPDYQGDYDELTDEAYMWADAMMARRQR